MKICHNRMPDQKHSRSRRPLLRLTASLLLLCLLLAGCGGGGAVHSESSGSGGREPYYGAADTDGMGGGFMEDVTETEHGPNAESSDADAHTRRPEGEDVKLILRASLVLETTDYEQSAKSLSQLVSDYNGYFENTEVDLGAYASGAGHSGHYTVRIPRDHFDAFLNSAASVCHLVSRSETAEDVGTQYHDAELRVKTLRTKEERLLALMRQAAKIEDIIALEDSLTEVQYEIEQYTTQLNRYDSLIGYSTVDITLSQVDRLSSGSAGQISFSRRLGAALRDGFLNTGDGLASVIVLLAYNLVPIAILIAIAVFILWFTRKRKRQLSADGGSQDGGSEGSGGGSGWGSGSEGSGGGSGSGSGRGGSGGGSGWGSGSGMRSSADAGPKINGPEKDDPKDAAD